MRVHFTNEMNNLKLMVASLATAVEKNVSNAIRAVLENDEALRRQVSEADHDVDTREVRIEEEALKNIALHQPVADDLRYMITIQKVDHELERISDLGVSIAKTVRNTAPTTVPAFADAIDELGRRAWSMVSRSIDALMNTNAEMAKEVWFGDDAVDNQALALQQKLQGALMNDPDNTESYVSLLLVCLHMERMADHATNISKDVIYLVTGEIARHRGKEFREQATPEK